MTDILCSESRECIKHVYTLESVINPPKHCKMNIVHESNQWALLLYAHESSIHYDLGSDKRKRMIEMEIVFITFALMEYSFGKWYLYIETGYCIYRRRTKFLKHFKFFTSYQMQSQILVWLLLKFEEVLLFIDFAENFDMRAFKIQATD